MRLFTALDLPGSVIDHLQELVRQLRPAARLRWSPPENLHITTKFIGDWPEDRLAELRAHLPAGPSVPEIIVSGVGFFPNDRYPKVFYARVAPSPELLQLAKVTDFQLSEFGVPIDKHPYRPHVTLARVPESLHLHALHDRIAELSPGLFGSFEAIEYSLFESKAGRYTRLSTHALEAGPR